MTAVQGRADDEGAYRLVLPAPGTCTITVGSGSVPPFCPEGTATVAPGQTVTNDINCDSGIRTPGVEGT